jgi:hypothetical protein
LQQEHEAHEKLQRTQSLFFVFLVSPLCTS